MRVLVVEDELLIAKAVTECLKQGGYEVVGLAGTVSSALNLIKKREFDTAIVDLNLGGDSADPIIQRLLDQEAPIIVTTGYSEDRLPKGIKSYLLKPFTPVELLNALSELQQ